MVLGYYVVYLATLEQENILKPAYYETSHKKCFSQRKDDYFGEFHVAIEKQIMKRIIALSVTCLLVAVIYSLQSCRKDEPQFQDYYLNTQKDIDNFNLSSVNDNLHINGQYINNLSNLSKVRLIKGSLSIYRSHMLKNLDGLHNLSSIDSGLYIHFNLSLDNITHLSKLEFVGGNIQIFDNENLKNIQGLSNIRGFTNEIHLNRNISLESLKGLRGLSGAELSITGNSSLASLSALSGINELKSLYISGQNLITSLDGLEEVELIEEYLYITNNNRLISINELSNLKSANKINICENTLLDNLDGLENINAGLTFVSICRNPSLTNFCSLVPVLNANKSVNLRTELNKYNPTYEDILNGDCGP